MEISIEEKKAIEILQEFKKTGYHTLRLKYNEDRIHTNKLIERALETALNLIETQKAELEKKDSIIEDSQEVESNMVADLEKKDKIIDKMVQFIYELFKERPGTLAKKFKYKLCISDDCDDINREVNCDYCIKEYFTKLVEGEKKDG